MVIAVVSLNAGQNRRNRPTVAPYAARPPLPPASGGVRVAGSDSYGWCFLDDAETNTAAYSGVRSPLKFCVLDLVERRGTVTYGELADALGMPPDYAANYLVRYARAGLLRRERTGGSGLSIFQLTAAGQSRLRYFRSVSAAP